MPSPLSMTAYDSRATFESIPPELTTRIFCQLPTFSDAFALAATCRRLRLVYSSNIPPIYHKIAPRSIPCLCQARRFCRDQSGSAEEASLSTKDIDTLVRNSHVVDKAMLQFESQIVCRVRMDGFSASEYYGEGVNNHPSALTHTERRRFIPAYYKIWDLMRSDPSMWSLKIEGMTLKRLYYLYEMTKLPQSIGQGEEQVPPPMFPNEPLDSVHSINSGTSEKRTALGEKVWARIQDVSQHIFGQDAYDPIIFAKHEGFMDFVVMWDHWHDSLKDLVGHRSRSNFRPDPAFEKQYLWDDSSDEER